MEVVAGLEPRPCFEHLPQIGVGRARIGRRFQHDERCPVFRCWRNRPAGREHVGDVRFAILVQRRRDADDHRLDFADQREIARGAQTPARDLFGDGRFLDVLDVAASAVDGGHFRRIEIQPDHRHAIARELQGQRQPDITQTNDGNCHMT